MRRGFPPDNFHAPPFGAFVRYETACSTDLSKLEPKAAIVAKPSLGATNIFLGTNGPPCSLVCPV
jgi:hypothetical protein